MHAEKTKFHFSKSRLDETVVNYIVTTVYEADLYHQLEFFKDRIGYLKIGDRMSESIPSHDSIVTYCIHIDDFYHYLYFELDEDRIIRKIWTETLE